VPKRASNFFNGQPMLLRSAEFDAWRELSGKIDGASLAALSSMPAARVEHSAVRLFGHVAAIRIEGLLVPNASLWDMIFSNITLHSWINKDINDALSDPNVSAIVLDINSPGGYVNGTAELADMIRRADTVKPVYAFSSGLLCSAAYWLASQARGIVATEGAEIGSIGVAAAYAKQETADRDGYRVFEFTSSNAKAKRPDPTTAEGLALIQKDIDQVEALFIERVAGGRKVSEEYVKSNFGNGAVFLGREALDRKMVDSVSAFDDFINKLNGNKGGNMPNPTNASAGADNLAVAKEGERVAAPSEPVAAAPAAPANTTDAAITAERTRCAKIHQAGAIAGMKAEDIQAAIDAGTSIEAFQEKAIAAKSTRDTIDASGAPDNTKGARKSLADLVEAKYGKKQEV